MPASAAEQQRVQDLVDAADAQQRQELRQQAEERLLNLTGIMSSRLLTAEESKAADIAIEILARLDCLANNGGWWYRSKRRMQLVQMYMG